VNPELKRIGRTLGRTATSTAAWGGERVEDAAMWAVNLLRDLPMRLARAAVTTWAALWGLVTWLPNGVRAWQAGGATDFARWAGASARRGGGRLAVLIMQLLDLIGAPELVSLLLRAVTRATPLTAAEIAAAAAVLGPTGLRYGDVRIAEGGLLRLVFKLNGGRAFTTFHTVNLPTSGGHQRSAVDILVHELVHVYQHECVGGAYIGECVYAQATTGYDYGGPEGLRRDRAAGKRYRDYNREQQAQIVQDYFVRLRHGEDLSAYEPFIAEMRERRV